MIGVGRGWEVVGAAVGAATLAGMLLAARGAGRVGRGRSALVAGAVVCVAAACVFVPLPRIVPHREVVAVRPADPPETDPLSRLPQWNDAPRDPLLHARFVGPPGDSRPVVAAARVRHLPRRHGLAGVPRPHRAAA